MAFWDWQADTSVEETHAATAVMFAHVERGEAEYWTARLKDGGAFVGLFDLNDLRSDVDDLGFMIGRGFQGKGYAFEAATCLLNEVRQRSFSKLKARIHVGNVRSGRLLDCLGFSHHRQPEVEIRLGEMQPDLFYWIEL